MRQIAPFLLILVCFHAGCSGPSGTNGSGKKNETDQPLQQGRNADTTDAVFPRNKSITENNSYNDLFLDSLAMEDFITRQQPGDRQSRNIRSFYNARNYQFAWLAKDGFTEQTFAFRSLYDYSKDSSASRKFLDNRLDDLMQEDGIMFAAADPDIIKTELMLTWRFVNFLDERLDNKNERERALRYFVPARKQEMMRMAASLLKEDQFDGIETGNDGYQALKTQLKKYLTLVQDQRQMSIPVQGSDQAHENKPHRGKDRDARYRQDQDQLSKIRMIKKRLELTGELAGNDTTGIADENFRKAIQAFQSGHGHKPTGKITPGLIREMNESFGKAFKKILVNLERIRWMPSRPKEEWILVNIPEFRLHMMKGKEQVFDMDIVVGKEGHSTVMFAGDLDQIVFSPYWNLPPSIVKKEVLAHLRKDKQYLVNNKMEITGEKEGLPVIRQLPGGKNELGKIKFLFPNSFNIYFHDTPHKGLFSEDKRAFSHGCIRLAEPEKLAAYLLQPMPEWTIEKVEKAMNSGKEKHVNLQKPVTVLIGYYTAWVDETGTLQFRDDIYGHDGKLASKLFSDEQNFE